MPWHFGGDEGLTYAEAAAYVTAIAERDREARQTKAKADAKKL